MKLVPFVGLLRAVGCTVERDRMAQGEPNQLYWVGFFLFGPFPEENMFGFS